MLRRACWKHARKSRDITLCVKSICKILKQLPLKFNHNVDLDEQRNTNFTLPNHRRVASCGVSRQCPICKLFVCGRVFQAHFSYFPWRVSQRCFTVSSYQNCDSLVLGSKVLSLYRKIYIYILMRYTYHQQK